MEKIIDIKLNAKEAIAQVKTLDEEIVKLEDNISDFQGELLKMEAELGKLGGSGKDLARKKKLNDQIEDTKNLIKQENLALKNNKRAKLEANKETANLNKKLKEQAKAHNEVSKGLVKTIGGTGVLDRATGGLYSKFSGLTTGLSGATNGMKLFKVALIGTGVGALIVALGSLITYFKSSEEGQNKLTKAMNVAGATVSNLVETVSKLGEGLLNVGSSIKNFFTGKGSVSDIGKAIGDTYDKVSEKVSTLAEDIKEDAKVAMDLSDQLAKADKIDRKLMVDRAKANEKVALLRTKAYDTEKFNAQERIGFLEEAMRIEDEVTDKEIEAARIRFNAKKAENEMTSLATKEDLDEQAKLEAKLNDLEYKKLNRVREVANQRQTILRQEQREKDKIQEEAKQKEKERLESLQEIRDEYDQLELEKEAQTELQKVELEETNKIKELESLNASEEAKQQVRDYYYSLKDDARKADEEKADLLRQQEKEKEEALAQAKRDIQMSVVDNVAKGFSILGKLAGKNRALQAAAIIGENAAGVAKQIIATKSANALVTAKYAAIPGGAALATVEKTMNNVSLGLGIASSAIATKQALSALKTGGSVNTPSASSEGGRGASSPPAFNVVGTSPENQLANAIGEKDTKPVKAFVVSNEITNAQALERNIIEGSTIG